MRSSDVVCTVHTACSGGLDFNGLSSARNGPLVMFMVKT
jgi:hypothetical protein